MLEGRRRRWMAAFSRAISASSLGKPAPQASDTPTESLLSPWHALDNPAGGFDIGFHPFHAGDLVSGRFQIVREIAEGGMGLVYLAIDQKLNQPRALKCAKHGYANRLTPEARIALQVTHPNVCRMYEIHTAETPMGPVDFLAMEYVEGRTLAAHIRQKGALPEPEAREIAFQICAGVAAAHAQNLLHRDLKPLNVLLADDAGDAVRAVVTDFGLAQESSAGERLPDGAKPAGTAGYIAPELLEGKPASVASDIYSLGILLHEMIAGVRPEGSVKQIPARWRNVIQRCLDSDPGKRYRSAAAVAAALQSPTRLQWAMTAAGALLIVALLVWRAFLVQTPPARLAILAIEAQDSHPRTAALARGVTYDLSGRLMRLNPRPPQLVVIPTEETRGLTARSFQRVKETLGATHALRASFAQSQSKWRARGAIVDTATQLPLRDFSFEFDPADPGAAAASLFAFVSASFNLPRQASSESVSPAAYSDYTVGMALLRGIPANGPNAAAAFEKAASLDRTSPLPPAALAEACYQAWVDTSDASWLDRGRKSLALAQRLSPDSLAVRLAAGKLNLAPGSFERATQEFQRAIQLDPASAEAWRGLARSYEGMDGRNNDAVSAYLKAIELQPGYYLPHQNLGTFYRKLGNYAEAEKHWKRVTEIAPGLFTGRANLGGLYAEMGRWQESERELRVALEIDPRSRIALNNLGALYQYMGRDADAAALFERSLALGSESHVLWLNLGDSYRRAGHAVKAAAAYRRARMLAEKALLDNPRDAALRGFVAYFALRLGDRTTAQRELALALDLGRDNKTVLRRAVICYEVMGQRERALAVLQSATPDLLRELGRQPDLTQLRQDPRFAALNPH